MADDSDIDIDLDDIGDDELKVDVEAAQEPEEEEVELIDAADLPAGDAEGSDEEEEVGDYIETESEPMPKPGPVGRHDSEQIVMRTRVAARDSRQLDILSIFELTAIVASRACLIANNAPPLVPFSRANFDPAQIARDELAAGKSLRAVLRGDTLWRWGDFAYFPLGFLSTHGTTARLHEIN
jgi:DNA-directed RNA polymerase subunit K/omega